MILHVARSCWRRIHVHGTHPTSSLFTLDDPVEMRPGVTTHPPPNHPSVQLQSAIMRIGFFGGSFDPPHLGHLAVARAAADAFSLDRVLFVPTAYQPLKPNGAAASYQDRLTMVSFLCKLQPDDISPHFESSALDAPRPDGAPNYTVDTLARLRNTLLPTDRLFVILGADAFLGLPRWRSPDTLFTLAEWIIVSRPNVAPQELSALKLTPVQEQRIHQLNGVHEPAAATQIRALLAAGSDCSDLLSPSLLRYIRAHHLYGA